MQMLHKINWGTFKCALDLSMRFYEKWKNLHWCLLISVGYFSAFAKHLNADKQVAKRTWNVRFTCQTCFILGVAKFPGTGVHRPVYPNSQDKAALYFPSP